jgi:hypothetical protein
VVCGRVDNSDAGMCRFVASLIRTRALRAYIVFMSSALENPNGLRSAKRMKYQYIHIQS